MLKVYDKNETDFTKNGLAVLNKAQDVNISREINGEYRLNFSLPGDDLKWQYIQQRNKVVCEGQQFRIYRRGRKKDGSINKDVECLHVISDAAQKFIPYLQNLIGQTPRSILLTVFAGTSFYVMTEDEVAALGMSWVTDFTDIFECSKTNPLEVVKKVIENIQKGELYIDNYSVALVEKIGKDTGLRCSLSNNLQAISDLEDSNSLITRLYAYGKDDLPLPIAAAPNGYIESSEGIALYGVIEGYIDYDTGDPEELHQKALWEFSPDNPNRKDVVDTSYTIELIELYKLLGNNYKVGVGDSIVVIDKTLGIETKQRVVKYNCYPFGANQSNVTLGRPPKTYADVIKSSAKASTRYTNSINQSGEIKTSYMENLSGNLKQTINASLKEVSIHKKGDLWEFGNNSAIAIVDGMLAIANSRDAEGNWNFRTFGTGNGFTADEIVAGILKGIQIQQLSDSGNKLMEVYKDVNGGVIKVYDNSQLLNIKVGVESGTESNVGGTLVFYKDSPYSTPPNSDPYKRIEMGIRGDYGAGVTNYRDNNAKARISLSADSGLGPYIGVKDTSENLKSFFTQDEAYAGGKRLATEEWVLSIIG